MIIQRELPLIEDTIRKIEKEFQLIKGLLLTESDLKCHIYSRLNQYIRFKLPTPTREERIYATSLHTELSWYDEDGNLSIVPDITILETEQLSILRGLGDAIQLPKKQFQFAGNAIIFELKLVREPRGISRNVFIDKIVPDFRKIHKLFRKLESEGCLDQVYCFFVIFNKTNKVCEEFRRLLVNYGESPRHKIIYGTGNIDMVDFTKNYSDPPSIQELNRLGACIPFNIAGKKRLKELT